MKYLLSVAILAISAVVSSLADTTTIPPPPLACSVVTPVQGDVWVMGKTATVTWSCKTALPLEKQLPSLLMAMELGTGTPTSFTYVDTLDDADELRRVSFPFILLTKYTPGNNYLVRIRSKNHGDPDPVTAEDDNKLQWSYSPNFKIVGAGGSAVTNNTATNSTSKPTGGSATSGNSTSSSSTTSSSTGSPTSTGSSTSSSANNSTKGSSGSSKSTAGIVNVNAGAFFSTIMAALVAAAFF